MIITAVCIMKKIAFKNKKIKLFPLQKSYRREPDHQGENGESQDGISVILA